MPVLEAVVVTVFWSVVTILFYLLSKRIYRRFPTPVTSPLLLAPVLLILLALLLKQNYAGYIHATHWLVLLLGPATVAFALPIFEQWKTIRRYWPVLLFGVIVGSSMAILSAWGLATLLGLNGSLRLSLLPRSLSTPFAMNVSQNIGGVPDLTAVFVVITGVSGAIIGDFLIRFLPLRSAMARGALFGMGAHGAGVAKATEIGLEESSVAGLVMVLVGVVNVLTAPLLHILLNS
ncbi:LrgB family protein [Martelella sp. HB161492]|uniref:LrgB family protein n=1 Tax=Martelella sp. HB161492 TaxID=2720726 RepID=UPI00159063DD|nr:LrgB family protein [Martelella sp. HB161492]